MFLEVFFSFVVCIFDSLSSLGLHGVTPIFYFFRSYEDASCLMNKVEESTL